MKTVEDYNTRYKYLEQLKESGKLYVRKDISNISVGDYVRVDSLRSYQDGLVKSIDKSKRRLTYTRPKTTEDHLGNKTTKLVSKTVTFSDVSQFVSDKPESEEKIEEHDTEQRIFTEITERAFSNLEMDIILSDARKVKVIHERGELNLHAGDHFRELYHTFRSDFYNRKETERVRQFITDLKKYFSTFGKIEKYWVQSVTRYDEEIGYSILVLTIYLFDPRQGVPSAPAFVPSVEIQHWKLTWEEYAQTVYISSGQKEAIQNAWAKVVKPTNKKDYNQLLEEWWEANNPHRKLVLKAYSEGKPVPTHILKFYKIMKNNILSGLQGFGFVPDLPSVIKVGDKVYSTNNTTIYTVGAAAWQTGAPIGTTPLTKITEAGKYIGKVKSIKGDVITLDYDKPRFVKYSEVQKEGTPGGAPNPNVPAPFGPGTTEPPKPEPDTSTGSGMKKYLPLALAAAAGLALYSMSSGGSGRRKKKRSGLFGTYHGRNGVKTIPVKIGNQTMKIHLKTTEVK